MACPSVCPQTNRMKAWPLIPPRVLPFSHRPTAKQPENTGPVLQRGRERESKNNRAISTKLNNTITITVLITHFETMRKKTFLANHSDTMLEFFQDHVVSVGGKIFMLNYLCGRCGCSLFWIPVRERKPRHQRGVGRALLCILNKRNKRPQQI